MSAEIRIGTSGWNYAHWGNGVFYPTDLGPKQWFSFYSQHFDTVEINNTFYQLPQKATFENWEREAREGFIYSVKASRFITHMKKLKDPPSSLMRFMERVSALKGKLGPILFQLPPFWGLNLDRLREFLDFIRKVESEGELRPLAPLRIAIEIRHPSWYCEAVFRVLEEYNVCLCFADWPELKVSEPVTADFVYIRRHGPTILYASGYSEELLRRDAEAIRRYHQEGRDVYVYFNNDAGGWAVQDAKTLQQLLQESL